MHEWRVWEVQLPDGKLLIPGFLSHGMSFVEHPQLIADQIETFARLVGREDVIARRRLRLLVARLIQAGGAPER